MNTNTSRRRLLIVLNRFVIGGQAVDTIPLVWRLKDDFDILIIYGEKEKDEVEPDFLLKEYPGLKLTKIRWLKRSINPFVDLVAFVKVLLVIARFKPHIVHTHGAKSGLFGRVTAFICRVPVIVHTFHGHLFHSYFSSSVSSLIKFIERSLARITSGFIVLSTSQFTDLVNVFKIVPIQKCRIIPLGFDVNKNDDLRLLRQNFRHRFGLNNNDVAIGIVGRIVHIKNHQFFVRAVQALLQVYPQHPPVFFIIGDGDLRSEIEQKLQVSGIPFSTQSASTKERVVFTSWLSNIAEVMCGLDIVALTSMNEGTPLSIIEAQAYGKPVVATNVGGVRDTMLNGQSGFIVDNGDLNSFVQKLQHLINNEILRADMGAVGVRFVQEKFSKKTEVAITKDFYISLLKSQGVTVN